ncbi:MAG TPA: DNA starvation/stationary phase protection protein [Chloroflexia bacterium]|nr:DNA starvation/stationary phase protection protein [Chloroflexia bacterium]
MATKTQNGRRTSQQAEMGSPNGQPILHQRGREVQAFGTVRALPIGLDQKACQESADLVNQILADTITLYSMYKKHHWQVTGPTFYQLHLLFDKHADEQLELIDLLAERVQTLGGVSTGMPADVARMSKIENPPAGAEEVPVMISRLLEAHELICGEVREGIDRTDENKDWGTNDLLMSEVLRRNELQVWFVSQHVVDEPLVRAGDGR